MSAGDDSLRVLRQVLATFQRMGIPYALGGSMASSIHGRPRFTRDADVTAEPFPGREVLLQSELGTEFYVSPTAMQEANRQRTSFNILHPGSGFKVDVFVRKEREFERSVMSRAAPKTLPDDPQQQLVIVSAEDIVLLKLEWFRIGGEASDRQWSDLMGVLKVQGTALDQAYLTHWAQVLGVADLLDRALAEADQSREPGSPNPGG